MKLSVYTFVKDGLRLDYHVVAMLRHNIQLVDEIVVVEGYSTDGTYEAICNLDPKIKIIRRDLGVPVDNSWTASAKNQARRACTGDWCILLDCDEFLTEWEMDRLRQTLQTTSSHILEMRWLHFYGNYRVYAVQDHRNLPPPVGQRIHRNIEEIEAWGDGCHVRSRTNGYTRNPADPTFEGHHFGEVRHAARLREKWRAQSRRHRRIGSKDWVPHFLYDLMPHNWCDPGCLSRLRIYDGPFIGAVREDPDEFVRDGFKVYRRLQGELERTKAASTSIVA